MRRRDKEITDRATIESIIRRAQVCRVGCVDNGRPYIIPLCFGYEAGALYFHAAQEGRKLDVLRQNPHVCFEFDIDQELLRGQAACEWGMKYRSVIGFGSVSILEDVEAKQTALDCIMRQYQAQEPYTYSDTSLEKTVIIKIDIHEMTGKVAGYAKESDL